MRTRLIKKIVFGQGIWIKVFLDGNSILMCGNQVFPRMEDPIMVKEYSSEDKAKAGLETLIKAAQFVGGDVYSYMQMVA